MSTPSANTQASQAVPPSWTWTWIVVAFVGAILTWQSHTLGLTTDEVSYIQCHEKLVAWLGDFKTRGFAENFTPVRLREGWYFGQFYNKNLPLIGLMSLVSDTLFGWCDSPPASYRWANIILFSATCGLIFRWVARVISFPAGLIAVAAIIGMPRLTSNAALLSLDPLIGCLWIWGTWLLTRSGNGWPAPISFAVICGLGFATKPTFWFIIPFWLAWAAIRDRKNSWRLFVSSLFIGGLTAYLALPMWWNNPVAGLWGYWQLLRAESGWQGVDAYYLGSVYQVAGQGKAPWHAVIVLTLVTTPLWILLLWTAGIWRWMREPVLQEPRLLWLIGFLLLPGVMMLPGTPCHDGIRMFLPSLLFGGMLAASGAQLLFDSFHRWSMSLKMTLSVAVLLASVAPLIWIQPAGLSYYNFLTGGLPGAVAAGTPNGAGYLSSPPTFEATYWWEVMTDDNWRSMQNQIPKGKSVWVYPDFIGKDYLRHWGVIRTDLQFAPTPREADYWLLYGRMGRLMQPSSHPMEVRFHTLPGLWEARIHGARLAVLVKRP